MVTGNRSCLEPVATCRGAGLCYLLGVFTLPNARCLGERLNWLNPVKFQYDDKIFVELNLSKLIHAFVRAQIRTGHRNRVTFQVF